MDQKQSGKANDLTRRKFMRDEQFAADFYSKLLV